MVHKMMTFQQSKITKRTWHGRFIVHAALALAAMAGGPVWSAGINDTGITAVQDQAGNPTSCADGGEFPRQDGCFGRDLTAVAKIGAGSKGFDFTKMDSNGTAQVATAPSWACTKDNVTGLTWEVKTTAAGLHNLNNTYTWHQGGVGVPNGGSCSGGSGCDTASFVADVNAQGLCGANDWRMPTVKELEGLVDYGSSLVGGKAFIDISYFPETPTDKFFWTGAIDAASAGYSWFVDFADGSNGRDQYMSQLHVRLVRGAANPNQFVLTDGGLTVTDNSTGLVWKRDYEMLDAGQPQPAGSLTPDWFTWSDALKRSVSDRTAGYSDWRLPSVRELRSLVDDSISSPSINTNFFPVTVAGAHFLTSSPTFDRNQNAMMWIVSGDYGNDLKFPPYMSSSVRLVRDRVNPLRGELNDTGVVLCADETTMNVNCASLGDSSLFPRQDGRHGRDPESPTKTGGGHAGFDFSRISNDSMVRESASLGAGSTDWACTRDNVTGLIWEVKTESGYRSKAHKYTWYINTDGTGGGVMAGGTCDPSGRCDTQGYIEDVNAQGLCGYNDWRLPTIKELESIVDYSRINPPVDPDYFRNTALSFYWSSTPDSSYSGFQYVWISDFMSGMSAKGQPLHPQAIRLVRGTSRPTNQYTVSQSGLTVTDSSTGLMWKRDYEMMNPFNPATWQEMTDRFTWSEALQRALTSNNANFDGYSDWRLPNIKELRSLISESRHDPAIDITVFPPTIFQAYFWSSTPRKDFHGNQDMSWALSGDIGVFNGNPRTFRQFVRLVRNAVIPLGTSLVLSSETLDFGSQPLSTPSAEQVVTLTNNGAAMISGIGINPGVGDYEWNSTCALSLAAGQSCTISVTFTPSVGGSRTGVITIVSDAIGSPHRVALTGSGSNMATQYGLTVSKSGTGTGRITAAGIDCGATCVASYYDGTSLNLSAVADAGSSFTGWSGAGCAGNGACSVNMVQNVNVAAIFTANSSSNFTLTVVKSGNGAGTVAAAGINCGSTCSAAYSSGASITLTATASPGSTFIGWTGSGCTGTGSCVVSMTQARSVTASFTTSTVNYTLTLTKGGTGSGVVTSSGIDCGSVCSASYTEGTSVMLTAASSPGSVFTGWNGGGCLGTGYCVASMTQARSVKATFELKNEVNHTLTVSKAGTGSGTVSAAGLYCGAACSATYPAFSSIPLTAVANAGSVFSGWSGGGCSGMSACSIGMIQARSVTATFQLTSTPPISLYDGIYQWDATSYLSVHQLGVDAIVASIYWVYDANKVQIGGRSLPAADTFDLLQGTIVGTTAMISGTRFYRACKLSYELEFNSDSTITVTRTGAINSPGVSLDQVNCAARYSAEPTIWPVIRIF